MKINSIGNETTKGKADRPPSFIKLAMRNMVRKGKQSLAHFSLTAAGFLFFIIIVAWLGRPHIPQ